MHTKALIHVDVADSKFFFFLLPFLACPLSVEFTGEDMCQNLKLYRQLSGCLMSESPNRLQTKEMASAHGLKVGGDLHWNLYA